jgi:hypothetical protein
MKTKPCLASVLILVCTATLFPILNARAAATWTGGLFATNVWSDTNNWDTLLVPGFDSVTFTNTGSTNIIGVVNNVLDTNLTITTFNYKAQVSFVGNITNYHTTLINPGVTLTIDNGGNTGALINSGDTDPAIQDNQYYATITGTNASVIAGNVSSPVATQGLQSTATSASITNHIGSLDLSGLDNFTFAGGYVWVGASAANAAGATDRPVGKMYLARTNLIIAISSAADGSFRVGESKGNTPPRESQLELGQDNAIYAAYMKIGGSKAGPSAGGRMYFRPSLTNNNPTLKLRGGDGVSRLPIFAVGENTLAAGSSIGTRGTVELTGGTVDVLVDLANVGRSTSGSGTGAATGTVTWTGGTVDITTLNLGYQSGNTTGSATGTMNVRGANARLIVGTITMGRDGGSGTGRGIATVNLTGGAIATVAGTILENSVGGDGTSTLNITDSLLNTGDIVTVDNINLNNGVISNAALVTVSVLKGPGSIAGPVTVVSNLSPGLPIGTLTVSNDLTLSSTCSTIIEVNLDTLTADKVTVLSNITFSGALTLTNVAGTAMATNGASFKIFDATTYTGSFSATNLPALGGGVSWDLSTLGTDGMVKLVVSVNPTPTNMVFQATGGAVDISWPSDHIGWRLQAQSNPRTIGISTNWVTVAGSDSTNHVTIPIDPADGTVFYRMIYP